MDEQEVKIIVDKQGFLYAKNSKNVKAPIFLVNNRIKIMPYDFMIQGTNNISISNY